MSLCVHVMSAITVQLKQLKGKETRLDVRLHRAVVLYVCQC